MRSIGSAPQRPQPMFLLEWIDEKENARDENDPVPKCHGIGETTGDATGGRREGSESRWQLNCGRNLLSEYIF